MRALTRFFFAVSDAVAWLVMLGAAFLAVALVLTAPMYAKVERIELSWVDTAWKAAVLLLLALLSYATIRRKFLGVVMLCALAGWLWSSDAPAWSLWGIGVFLAVFALPYALAYGSLRLQKKESQAHAVSAAPDP